MTTTKNMNQSPELSAYLANLLFWTTDNNSTPVLKSISGENLLRGFSDFRLLKEQASNPDTPDSGYVLEFARSGKKYLIDSSANVTEIGVGIVNPAQADLRLSLSSTDPIPTGGLTSKATLYALPYGGDSVALYDPVGDVYNLFTIPTGFFVIVARTTYKTGDTTNGSNVITNFDGVLWKHVAIGYKISGTNIPAGTTVTGYDADASTITMSANATGDLTGGSLVLEAPADSRWDVFIWNNDGTVELHALQWTDVNTRATALAYGDGHFYLSGDQKYKYLGNFIVTDVDGRMEWSSEFRGIYNMNPVKGGQYLLDKNGLTLLGGYMSTTEKQAASWSVNSGDINTGTLANLYDGSTATYLQMNAGAAMTVEVDFGTDIVLDQIDFYQPATAAERYNSIIVYGSDTGDFAGEETTVVSTSAGDDAAGWLALAFSSPAQFRYWKLALSAQDGGNYGLLHEINFHYGSTLAVMGVPAGCEVELWNGASSVEAQVCNSLTRLGLVEFTAAVTSVDSLTITKPDGSLPWLEFTISPDTGDVFTLYQDQ